MKFSRPPLQLAEADIVAQVKGFLEARGWRPVRMMRTIVPGAFQAGEPGIPDYEFIYYMAEAKALVLWVEFKAPRRTARCRCLQIVGTRKRCTACDQRNWRERERKIGAAVWSGVDDLLWFQEQYAREFGWLHKGDRARGQMELLG